MKATPMPIKPIEVPILLWIRLLRELRRHGHGRRESGAFLLGRRSRERRRICSFVCYDDLDPSSGRSAAITFHARGQVALWKHCRKANLDIVADVHTHPGQHVGQSEIDRTHPMIPVVGHTAIILPKFARTPWWSLRAAGVYEYLGNFEWRAHSGSLHRSWMRLTLW